MVIFLVSEVARKSAMKSVASDWLSPRCTSEYGFLWRLCFDFLMADTLFLARVVRTLDSVTDMTAATRWFRDGLVRPEVCS